MDDYASAPDDPSLDLGTGSTEDFTIEAFLYVPDLSNTTTDHLVNKLYSYALVVNFNNGGKDALIFLLWTGPGSSDYVPIVYSVHLSVGWHHIAGVFDNERTASADGMLLYLDGYRVADFYPADWRPGIPNSSDPLYIGWWPTDYTFSGWVKEVRLSNVIRYDDAWYAVPTGPFVDDANTRALWHFDEAAGSTIFADDSGNGNTLTGSNGAHTVNP